MINRNYSRAETLLNENLDILHAMKDTLMKYETIDAKQIDDLMNRVDVRPPSDWEERKPKDDNNSSDSSAKSEEQDNPDLKPSGDVPQ